MTRGSRRRSFFRPTRMIGRPLQKCVTSEYHYKDGKLVWQAVAQPTHLLLHVVQRVGRVDRETDEDNLDMDVSIVFTADDGQE